MRKVQDFIVKSKEVYVGLEDSKKTWKLCIRSGKRVIHEASMPAKYETLIGYFRNKFPECKIHVMYEAGFSGFGLHDDLERDGFDCIVTPPHTVTTEKVQRQKNDRIDCRRLSKNLENGDYGSCFIPSKQLREDRQISRLYGQIHGNITMVKNRIRRALEFHGLDKHFPSGSWNDNQYKCLQDKLVALGLSESLFFCFKLLLAELDQLRKHKAVILKTLRTMAKSKQYKQQVAVIESVPGIGILTAIRLALEWGDVRRFKRKEQFSSFLGLIPGEYSSGEQERKGHITKQGNRSVRRWLIECAWICIRKDPVMLGKYNAVAQNTGSGKKAIVAVARKLALRIRSLLIMNQPYLIGVVE
jgi:transposase